MGFKYKKVTWTIGGSDFPTSTAAADVLAKEQKIVKAVAQCIIDCGVGWQLDTSRNQTMDDFFTVPRLDTTNSYWDTGLFLTNTISGCKLFLCYVNGERRAGICVNNSGTIEPKDDFYATSYNSNYSGYSSICGLIMSMIPGDSTDNFGQTLDTSFLPNSATRLIGTMSDTFYTATSDTPNAGFARYNQTNEEVGYKILATADCIVVAKVYPENNTGLCYAVGKIIGTLAHSSDTTPQARYGTLSFGSCNYSYDNYEIHEYDYTDAKSSILQKMANNMSYGYYSSYTTYGLPFGVGVTNSISTGCKYFVQNTICKADGTWITNNSQVGVALIMPDVYLTAMPFINTGDDNSSRWTPIAIASCSMDLSTNGIVSGDGLKGYLDTDLFRCAKGTDGQLWANGAFRSFGSSILLGWDPDNDIW